MIRKAFILGAALFALALPLAAQTPDLAQSAKAALASGQIEMARILALAAIDQRPEDPVALAVLAAIGIATHEPEAARSVAVRSYRAATTKEDRFAAARLASKAIYDTGHPEIAKYWMRRAIQAAPTPALRNASVQEFQLLRRASPLQFDLTFVVRPSDNVNQGARDAMLTVDGQPTWFYFDGATRALSGVEAQLGLGLRYRLAGTPEAPTELALRVYHRAVALSAKAKAQAPGAKGADFANSVLELGLARTVALSDRQSLRFSGTLGRSFLAGMAYSDRARAETSLTTQHSKALASRFALAIERQWLTSGRPPATALSFSAGVQRRLASGDSIALMFELADTGSDDANQENRRIGAQLRYSRAKPLGGAMVSASLGLTGRDYPVYFNGIFNDTGRQDVTLSTSIDLALPKAGAFGFEPVLSLEASRTRSNISRYDGQTIGIGLRLQSSF